MRQFGRLISTAVIGIAAALLSPLAAMAQGGGAACPIAAMTPQIISASTLKLTSQNGCNVFVFTNPTGTIVTAPLASSVPQGFFVTLIPATVGGVTIIPAVGSLVNGKLSTGLAQGQTVEFLSDNANYWTFGNVSGLAPFPNLAALPGTFPSNSTRTTLPNGILKFTNAASFIPAAPLRACENAPTAFVDIVRAPTTGPVWIIIEDIRGQPHLIPAC